jgi:hypothetical protein
MKTLHGKRKLRPGAWVLLVAILVMTVGVTASLLSWEQPNLRFVSGTEYISGEYGQAIVRIANNKGEGQAGAACRVTILNPDKTFFILDAEMITSSEQGNYYREFLTPNATGIYEEIVECSTKNNGQYDLAVSSSFHVSVALNFIMQLSRVQQERYDDLVDRMDIDKADLLLIINETYNKGVKEHIERSQAEMLMQIRAEREQELSILSKDISERLNAVDRKFAALGTTMQDIFSGE